MNSDSFKNYFTLEKFSMLYDHYAFIDETAAAHS